LESQFLDVSVEVHGPFLGHRRNVTDLTFSLDNLLTQRRYAFAIVNSAESRIALEPLALRFVPSLFLVHEFASYVNPVSSFRSALDSCTEVVFSAPMVAKAAQAAHPHLAARTIHILLQGVTQLPPRNRGFSEGDALSSLQILAARREKEGTFIVLGVGFVHFRKGVDLFLSAAASVARRHTQRPIHFLWVGDGFRPTEDMHYSVYLQEQIDRSGLADSVTFLGVLSEVQPAYQIADAYFLSSRLDPLPNSAIDAAVAGIPVICFRDASGIADLLLSNPETALGVVDHLDSEAAASLLLNLAADPSLYKRIAGPTRQLARATFDLEAYCCKLEELGHSTSCRMKQRALDAETLLADPTFDQNMFLLPFHGMETRKTTISRYLALAASRGWQSLPQTDPYLRRPAAGFNPRVYAAAHSDRLRACTDPLADFIRCGKPKGPWQATVLRHDDPLQPVIAEGKLRVALHAHFFYPELCRDFLAHLFSKSCGCDLLISTNDSAKAAYISGVLSEYSQGTVEVRVVPNRGRDLGPLLTEFAHDLDGYDLIGHVHGKRSKYEKGKLAGSNWGEQWREFLWQNLLGGLHPMMDRIVAAFEQDERLGLVFPSDPNLVGWDANRDCAQEYAAKFGWSGPLHEHFDFPLGNMFWIRRPALQPLLGLRLRWDEYPEEPIAYDGTIVHALERLLPFACEVAGYSFAVTHVPGVSWSPAAE
jgi:glycosyltransferase involved in cell wall biosynthesis